MKNLPSSLRGSVEDSEEIKADLNLIWTWFMGNEYRKPDFLSHKSGPNNNTYLCVVNSLPNIDL
jgi:hypothetical protein